VSSQAADGRVHRVCGGLGHGFFSRARRGNPHKVVGAVYYMYCGTACGRMAASRSQYTYDEDATM
jgi:hypothetical protein